VQRDPAKDGVNWYAYVGNRPTMGVDPKGEQFLYGRSHGPGAGAGPGYKGPGYRFYRPCPRIEKHPCEAYACRQERGEEAKDNELVGQDCCDKLRKECHKRAQSPEDLQACRASTLCCYTAAKVGQPVWWLKACFKE